MAGPGKKFADVVVARFSKRPTPSTDDDGEPMDGASLDLGGGEPAKAADMDDQEADEQGKVALSAVAAKDPEALKEAIKAIVHECLEEYGVGK